MYLIGRLTTHHRIEPHIFLLQNYCSSELLLKMPNDDKVKALLADLGRATLRGVRKCPKCGTYNGTRGISCKNRACDVIFKEAGEKRKLSTDACKLITGASSQLYSVRVRDKGPDFRGFVYVPVVQNLDSETVLESAGESLVISQNSCQCFVETCLRSYVDKGDSLSLMPCSHIQAALRCVTEAQPLTLKNTILSALNITAEMKQAIWVLASETEGPLVQRVSKTIMVVKCKPSPKYPLGYLHCSFFTTKIRDRLEQKYCCNCKSFRTKKSPMKEDPYARSCLHYYACICAFASDDKLSMEFAYYINLEMRHESDQVPLQQTTQLVAVLTKQTESGTSEVEVQVLGDEAALLEATGLTLSEDGQLTQVHDLEGLAEQVEVQIQTVSATGETINFSTLDASQLLSDHSQLEQPDESNTNISFHQWLASVTERINETMHFQFPGKPEPLVFHVPQIFFDCLRERISFGGKKKRLPNFTTGFVRKDALPLGTFTKYTWHITNVIHVKRIFDTPLLQLTRSFVENRDGTYEHFQHRDDERELFRKTENAPLIRPLELKTFLKVGHTSPDQKEPTPFLIEWVPDILPQSHIGELRIEFQYGHQRTTGSVSDKKSSTPKILVSQIKNLSQKQ
ncbi:hypothetical protein B566_EDAN009276 [Ephemera danica]|nr:hypothetical protein B566_EDAN009276 [Ephemera danica]